MIRASERSRLEEALRRRRAAGLPASGRTDAFRLIFDAADGLPGLVVDALGEVAVLRLRTPLWHDTDRVRGLAAWLAEKGWEQSHVILDEKAKSSTRELAERETELNAMLDRAGFGASLDPFVVHENGRRYEMSVTEGFSQGLYLDMRGVRADLASRWKGRSVVNLFAYTCGFGVALAGGNRVLNVDVSPKYLAWGKRNYALNGLPVDDANFVAQDAFQWLDDAVARRMRFDAVVLDPPVFSRGKGAKARSFSIRTDFGELIEKALDLLANQGELFVSTNYAALAPDAFKRLLVGIARDRQSWLMKQWEPLPDHPTEGDGSAYHLKTALLVRQRERGARKPEGALGAVPGQEETPGRGRAASTDRTRSGGSGRGGRPGTSKKNGPASRGPAAKGAGKSPGAKPQDSAEGGGASKGGAKGAGRPASGGGKGSGRAGGGAKDTGRASGGAKDTGRAGGGAKDTGRASGGAKDTGRASGSAKDTGQAGGGATGTRGGGSGAGAPAGGRGRRGRA